MALDRTSLARTTSFQRRPAVSNTIQRAPIEAPRSTARVLQGRLGNRATQTLVAQSIARQTDAFARDAGAKSEKSCAPGSCECADCKHSPAKGSSLTEAFADGASSASSVLERGKSAAAGVDRLPAIPTRAEPTTAAPKPTQTPGNVLPFPTTTPRPTETPSQFPESMEKKVISQANRLSSDTGFSTGDDATRVRGAATSVRGQEHAEEEPTRAAAPARSAAARGQVVQADTVRSQAMIVSIATAMRQRISGLFSGVRARVSVFFTESALAVQQFIATQQMQIAAVVAQTIQSVHAAVDRAASAAEAIAANVRMAVDAMVQGAVGTLQAQVQGIANQIIGVISRFPQSSLPGVSQLRSFAASVLRRAASAVTAGLGRVGALISAALGLGMRVIQTIIGAARRLANAVVAQIGSVVQRILAVTFQILSRTAGLVGSALQSILNVSILPILNRVEGMIHRAITKAEKDAIVALRNNRDEYMASLSEGGGESEDEAGGSDELTKEALDNNRDIVQTFRERTSTVTGTIVQLITGAASQVIAHFRQMIAQVRQFITGVVRQAIDTLRRIVEIVSSVVQSLVRAVTSAVTRVVGYVRGLIQSPIDQLLRWSREVFNRMIDFIMRIGRSIVSAVTGTPSEPATGDFSPGPGLQPAPPTLDPGPVPIPIPVPAPPVPAPVPVPVPTPTPAPTPILLIIIIVIVIVLIILILLYLLYRWLKRRRRRKRPPEILHKTKQRKPGSRKRTTIGVGEEVFLEYTHGPTTWATTGGQLSVAPGVAAEKCRLDAPDVAGTITITAGTVSVAFNVVAPSGVFMDRRGGMKHKKDRPNSGIRVRPYIMPDTVNFYRITYHEMDVAFSTSGGAYACNPGAGGHCGKGGGGVPCDDLDVKNKVVAGRGTETVDDDCAFSGSCPGPATSSGSVFANIPHEYKVLGPTGTGFHSFPAVHQNHSLAADLLTLTTTKASASGTIKVTDNTVNNGCPPRV